MNKQQILGAVTLALCIFAVYIGHEETKPLGAFQKWKAEFGVSYDQDEDVYRKLIFDRKVEEINAHNADETQTYQMGVNQFTALTEAEFIATYLGPWAPSDEVVAENQEEFEFDENLGDIDWVSKGMVTGVKNQGSCGSCWAFSATGVIESAYKLKGRSVNLSEQQLVDCSRPQGNQGCNGGWPSSGIKYVMSNGIASQSQYPYTARDATCKKNGGSTKVASQKNSGPSGVQNALNSSPLSVTVDASKWSSYRSGIFNNCGTNINHAVLMVGYTSSFWKIKNSWGSSWGESGYIRLAPGNTCGVTKNGGVSVSVPV